MSDNNQGETCAACDPKTHISAEVKAMFKQANLTWEKLAELDEGVGRGKGSYRQTFLARLVKAQETLQKVGYSIRIERG